MNSSQIHLALTHVPVILSFVGLILLLIAWIRKNEILTRTSFYILFIAGLFTLPVYFTGEGAEEIVENLPGVTEGVIEEHEEFASIALTVIAIGGLVALAGIAFRNRYKLARAIRFTTLVLALASAAAMAWTAHLGGQIRHSEIRSGFIAQNENSNASENEEEQEGRTINSEAGKEQTDKTGNQTIQKERSIPSQKEQKKNDDED